MKKISLILAKEGQEIVHHIASEKTLIGRDSTCDVVLDDVSISRKHAVIIYRFEKIYIENVSPSGQILKGDQPTEYAELSEKMEVNIGPYTLFWQNDEGASTSAPPSQSADDALMSSPADQMMDAPLSAEDENPQGDLVPYDANADYSDDDDAEVIGDHGAIAAYSPNEDESNEGAVGFLNSNEATQVTDRGPSPKLRVMKGEVDGREIKLDMGSAWVIGRSKKSHVQIDSKKISRQHFKVIRIGNKYRVQDMGSATGTKLNGVTVADAPLQPFDTIQAGAVEFQFLLVDASFEHLPVQQLRAQTGNASENYNNGFSKEDHNKSTIVNIPVPYVPGQESHAGASGMETESSDFDLGQQSDEDDFEEFDENEKLTLVLKIKRQRKKLAREWNKLPQQKKIIYSSALLALVLLVALGAPSSDKAAVPTRDIATEVNSNQPNLAQNPDISPTFYALSLDKQNKIRKLYQTAEMAAEKKQWQQAYEAANEILESVDKYERTKDIMLAAQAIINKNLIDKISPGVDDARNAQKANQEKINILLDSGTNALRKGEWLAAEEAFISVLTLDPTNKEAEHGLFAARKQDPLAINDGSTGEESIVKFDPEYEAKKREEEFLQTFESRYNEANRLVLESRYDQAVPILEDLYSNLAVALDEYRAGRGPADIRNQYVEVVRGLQSKTQESYSQIEQNLSIEYQTQIADAEQYLTNRQYVMARKAYDKILQQTPYFSEVQRLRGNLYRKIVTEAKNLYRGALIYESIGNVNAATSNLQKASELLTDVKEVEAMEYLQKTESRLSFLQE